MADYTPAANALAATEQAGALAADERKDAAYNALKNTYGVALAGDPDTAIKDQEYTQRTLTNPIAVQQANANLTGTDLTNTGLGLANTYNAAANPLKLTGLADTNANTEASTANTQASTNRTNTLLPGEVSQQGATLKQTNAQTGYLGAETAHTNQETATSAFSLNTAKAAQDRTAAMGVLASLSDTASQGGDVGATFDKLAPMIAKYENVSPDHLTALRAAVVADPVNTINKLSEGINAANLQAAGGSGKAGTAALAMMKFSQGQMSLKDGLNFTQQRTAAVPGIVDQMQALLPNMSSSAVVAKAKALIPGTPEYQFEQLQKQLTANTSLDDIRTLKASGTSLGRVTNQEMGTAGNAIANLDLGQPTATLAGNLARVKNTYGIVNQNIAADIGRIGTGAPGVPQATQPGRPNLNQQQARAPVKFTSGVVYVDGAGNKATTPDGGKTWTPVP